jgi:hypothetical protein
MSVAATNSRQKVYWRRIRVSWVHKHQAKCPLVSDHFAQRVQCLFCLIRVSVYTVSNSLNAMTYIYRGFPTSVLAKDVVMS